MGFRAIERSTGVHHTTIIYWLKQIGLQLPDAPPINEIPKVGELDELETFVGSKKNAHLVVVTIGDRGRGRNLFGLYVESKHLSVLY